MAFGDNQIEGYEDEENNTVFHYKQGSFRQHEQERYRDLATGKVKTRPGIFKALVATKGNRYMFFTLLAVTAFALVYSFFIMQDNRDVINGTACKLNAFSFEDTVYVSLEAKNAKNSKETENQNLVINVEVLDSDGTVSNKNSGELLFTRNETQYYRTTFTDYNIANVKCSVTDGDKEILLSCKVEKR